MGEQARYDDKLKKLQLKLAGDRSQPNKLMDDCQDVLEYLHKEMCKYRSQSHTLKSQVSNQKEKLDEAKLHSSNLEAALNAKKYEGSKTKSYTERLKEELKKLKIENMKLKQSMKEMLQTQREQINKQNGMFKIMRSKHMDELKKQRAEFTSAQKFYKTEI